MRIIVRTRRSTACMFSILATFGLVTGMLAVLAPGAGARGVANTCQARNRTQGTPSGSNLQDVIQAANRGDTITVRYVCVGNFAIDKNLTLVGRATPEVPRPILHANGVGRALLNSARVKLINLKIAGGMVPRNGGGISNSGHLTLKDTVVRGNTAATGGGGIYNQSGTLTLRGASSVRGNTTTTYGGGGIYNHSATLVLLSTSSVTGNTAGLGGGIFSQVSRSTVILYDTASVSGNTANIGGGISNESGTLTLNDSSSVSDNTAEVAGGGIAINESSTLTLNGTSAVSGNTSGDWGGGIYNYGNGATVTLNDSSSVSGNTADSDDDASGAGGGVFVGCDGTLTGAVDGVNVNDNYLGTATPVEDNIVSC